MTHNRMPKLAAAAALLLAGAAGAAFAHPHPEDGGEGRKAERIVVVRDGHGEHHGKGDKRVRHFEIHRDGKADKRVHRFEIHRDGKGGHHAAGPRRFGMHGGHLLGCEGGEKIVDESAGDGDKKTKVIVCTTGKPTAATAERLEEALARITANDELSAEQKARITTALRSAIDRARSAR